MTNLVPTEIEPGGGRTILVVVAHADDPTLFVGGTIARWADAGWRIVVARATDDRWDSIGVDDADTIERNRVGLERAAAILGIAELIEFGLPTDVLGDASEVALRERVIRTIRVVKPYALVTFDPYGMFGEDNQDHVRLAAATDEAFWTAQFDKHHPEHFAEGLEPHGVFERWYFARRVVEVTDVVDIGATIDRKVEAALAHELMLRNLVHQLRIQARTGGWRVPMLDDAQDGDLRPLIELFIRDSAHRTGARHGIGPAEEFRVVRYGGLVPFLERFGQRLDAEPLRPRD